MDPRQVQLSPSVRGVGFMNHRNNGVLRCRRLGCAVAASFLVCAAPRALAQAYPTYPPPGYAPAYPVPPPPPPPPPQPSVAPPPQFQYYCDNPAGYYPAVPECPTPFHKVPVQP
jgi:hypothetical protein